jgi:hypothetical protein
MRFIDPFQLLRQMLAFHYCRGSVASIEMPRLWNQDKKPDEDGEEWVKDDKWVEDDHEWVEDDEWVMI